MNKSKKYKRITALIPADLYPEIKKKMYSHGFTAMSGYIRFLLIRELKKQQNQGSER